MALVLSRVEGQSVTIDGPCVIHVKSVHRGRVVLSFDGPGTKVLRSELVEHPEPFPEGHNPNQELGESGS